MAIKRLQKEYKGFCDYCGRNTILRYELRLTRHILHICTFCFEEQMELAQQKAKKHSDT